MMSLIKNSSVFVGLFCKREPSIWGSLVHKSPTWGSDDGHVGLLCNRDPHVGLFCNRNPHVGLFCKSDLSFAIETQQFREPVWWGSDDNRDCGDGHMQMMRVWLQQDRQKMCWRTSVFFHMYIDTHVLTIWHYGAYNLTLCDDNLTLCAYNLTLCAYNLTLFAYNLMLCAYNLMLCADNLTLCAYNLTLCADNLMLCAYNLTLCAYNLMLCAYNLMLCAYNLMLWWGAYANHEAVIAAE